MPAEALASTAEATGDLGGLAVAFETFTTATRRLEREYGALRRRVAVLSEELEEKNRLLGASLERERRLEAEALRQSRLAAMGEMAAMLAHEIRNPLGAMELFTGLLLQDLRDQPEAQRLARQVAAGIVDLNHLVTNLLEFTRTRVAGAEPERAPHVDCCALAEDALRYAADVIAAHDVRVERAFAAGVTARVDAGLLRPVLLNLVRNAAQAMADGGGTLTVTVVASGAEAAITVADTGPGIAEDLREAIFQPFFTTRAKGTGLGLTVVRELTRVMGGSLSLGGAPGRGAAFTIRLPAGD
jgi:signal transduction histidine kinase